MMSVSPKGQIRTLQFESLIKGVESISVFVFSLVASSFIPNLLIRYVYADQNLLEQPRLLEYIPIAAFALGTGYFIYAMVGNWMRAAQIKKIASSLPSMSGSCCSDCGDACSCDEHGNCDCGCDTMMGEVVSTGELAAKMKTMNKKKMGKRK